MLGGDPWGGPWGRSPRVVPEQVGRRSLRCPRMVGRRFLRTSLEDGLEEKVPEGGPCASWEEVPEVPVDGWEEIPEDVP